MTVLSSFYGSSSVKDLTNVLCCLFISTSPTSTGRKDADAALLLFLVRLDLSVSVAWRMFWTPNGLGRQVQEAICWLD